MIISSDMNQMRAMAGKLSLFHGDINFYPGELSVMTADKFFLEGYCPEGKEYAKTSIMIDIDLLGGAFRALLSHAREGTKFLPNMIEFLRACKIHYELHKYDGTNYVMQLKEILDNFGGKIADNSDNSLIIKNTAKNCQIRDMPEGNIAIGHKTLNQLAIKIGVKPTTFRRNIDRAKRDTNEDHLYWCPKREKYWIYSKDEKTLSKSQKRGVKRK